MRALLVKTLLSLVVFITLGLGQTVAQCAMCRTTIENNVSAGETSIASGLNIGILYLFATPYILFLVIATLWYKKSRRNAKKIRFLRYPKS